jgi:hypothetical protein
MERKKSNSDVFPVRTTDFQSTILAVCKTREDDWARTVFGRIQYAQDLHAADAIYHQECSVNFRTGKQISQAYSRADDIVSRHGKNPDLERAEAFTKVMAYLEANDDEQCTLSDLVDKMKEYLDVVGSTEKPYCAKYMKKKLEEHFGDGIVIAEVNGKTHVVTLCSNAANILRDYFNTNQQGTEDSKRSIIETTAKLIRADIKSLLLGDPKVYPDLLSMTNESMVSYLPRSLVTFLQLPTWK